jgi:hypothetical protein
MRSVEPRGQNEECKMQNGEWGGRIRELIGGLNGAVGVVGPAQVETGLCFKTGWSRSAGATPSFSHLTLVIDVRALVKKWRVLRIPMGASVGTDLSPSLSPLPPE